MAFIARNLGVERTGEFVQGSAAGAVLAVLAGSAVRPLVVREIAREPALAGAWIRAAVRARLRAGALLAAVGSCVALLASTQPLFWALCCLLALPAAYDLKVV